MKKRDIGKKGGQNCLDVKLNNLGIEVGKDKIK